MAQLCGLALLTATLLSEAGGISSSTQSLDDHGPVILGANSLPTKWNMSGMTFTGGRYCPSVAVGSAASNASMAHLRTTGADWVSLVVTEYQWNVSSTEIFPLFNASAVKDRTNAGYYHFLTLSDAELRRGIQNAKAQGLKVMLKPHVDLLRNSHPKGVYWRGDIGCSHESPFGPPGWTSWFKSYSAFIVKYARLAQEEGVELLSLNCELYCANRQASRWRDVVASVRKVFSGLLTEAAMPQGCAGSAKSANGSTLGGRGQCAGRTDGMLLDACSDGVTWWDDLDIIGMDAYFVLNGTSVQELVKQWAVYKAWAKGVSQKYLKPVVFTEIGYCSGQCSRTHTGSQMDAAQQARHYQALFEAMRGEEAWFLGAFWWNWNSDDGRAEGDDFLSPQHKPAEDILRRYYRAVMPKPPTPAVASGCAGAGKGTC